MASDVYPSLLTPILFAQQVRGECLIQAFFSFNQLLYILRGFFIVPVIPVIYTPIHLSKGLSS